MTAFTENNSNGYAAGKKSSKHRQMQEINKTPKQSIPERLHRATFRVQTRLQDAKDPLTAPGQCEEKRRAFAQFTLGPYLAAMALNDMFYNG